MESGPMGGLLLIVAIIVIVIVVKVLIYKNKKKKEIEELKNSGVYEVAVKITEELEKIGFNKFKEPGMSYNYNVYGEFHSSHPERKYYVGIYFSEYTNVLNTPSGSPRSIFDYYKMSDPLNHYGVENDNITMLVTIKSENKSLDVPEPIKIAAEVIKNNGYGPCREIKAPR